MVKKYYKFILIFVFGLFLFIPKDTFAESVNFTENNLYWRAISPNYSTEIANYPANKAQFYQFGSATSLYDVNRLGMIGRYNSVGSGSYSADIVLYIENTGYNSLDFNSDYPSCNIYAEGTSSTCTRTKEPIWSTGTNGRTRVAFYYTYTWITSNSSQNYVEFYVDFPNGIYLTPSYTYFGYNYTRFEAQTDNSNILINQNQIQIEQNNTIINNQNETNNKLDDLNDNITDDSIDTQDTEDFLTDTDDYSNSPISGMLTMPITLLQNMLNGINGTCNSVNLGRFGFASNDLILPCIHPQNYLGSTLWGVIDALFSIFMIYNIAMLFIAYYDMILTLGDPFTYLYYKQPIYDRGGGNND